MSAVLALVSIGLLLSLLPPTSFVSRAADDIVDAVGPVWPEQSVEQGLARGLAVVSEVRIWAATGPDRGDALIVAGLLQGSGRELVRQVAVRIHASKLLQPYVLEFPPYRPVPGEASILQLWVSNERSNYAIFGTSARRDGIAGPTLNLNPTDQGPLAYELIWRGDGWRAALEGSWLDRLRLAGGIAAAALAVLLRPPVARWISKALRRVHAAGLVTGRSVAGPGQAGTELAGQTTLAHEVCIATACLLPLSLAHPRICHPAFPRQQPGHPSRHMRRSCPVPSLWREPPSHSSRFASS